MSGVKRYWCIKPIEFDPSAYPWLVEKYPQYVLASEYDLLLADRDAARRLINQQIRIGEALEAERDQLRAQVEAMRLLLEDILEADDEAIEGLSALGIEPEPQTTQLTERIRTALQANP